MIRSLAREPILFFGMVAVGALSLNSGYDFTRGERVGKAAERDREMLSIEAGRWRDAEIKANY